MANVVQEEVLKLIDKELEAANDKFGLNHSNHESFAVLREEIDEAMQVAAMARKGIISNIDFTDDKRGEGA